MRVLMLTYEIEGSGGSFVRAHSLARGLVSNGHRVTIWCAGERSRARNSAPDDVGAGFDGVEVVSFDGVVPRRLRHGGLDPLELCARLRAASQLRNATGPVFDVVHGFGHRPTVAWTGRALRRWLGIPYLADWADLWGMEGIGGRRQGLSRTLLGRADEFWERRVYSCGGRWGVDGLSVITSDLARRASAFGVADERIHLCPVGADVRSIVPEDRGAARERAGLPADRPTVCYVGFNNYDATYLAHAFVALARRVPNVHMLMVGIQLPEFDAILEREGLSNRVIHRGVVPHADLGSQLACGDVMLLPYLDRPINRGRYPNKIGDYMAAGRPTVANPTGDLPHLFERTGCGVLAGEDPEDFAAAAAALLEDPARASALGRRARTAAEQDTSWQALASDLADFYRRARVAAAPQGTAEGVPASVGNGAAGRAPSRVELSGAREDLRDDF